MRTWKQVGLLAAWLVSALCAGCGSSEQANTTAVAPVRLGTLSGGPVPMAASRITLIRYEGIVKGDFDKLAADTDNNGLYHALGATLAARGFAWQYCATGEPESVQGQALGAFQRAADTWNAAVPGGGLYSVSDGGAGTAAQDGVNSIGWSTQWGRNWPAAQISLHVRNNLIVGADILFNARIKWAVSPLITPGEARMGPIKAWDVQSVATHEFGHALGLDDVTHDDLKQDPSVRDATMFYELQEGELAPQTLTHGDIAGAVALAPAP